MNLRSPLGKVLGSGSAKEGTDHWWAQRLTAVGLLLLGSWFVLSMASMDSFAWRSVVDWAGHGLNSVLLVLLVLTLAHHSSLGVQVIIEDYVHGPFVKVAALVTSKFAHIFLAMVAVFAVLRIAFQAQV